jgi:hypothetical protein
LNNSAFKFKSYTSVSKEVVKKTSQIPFLGRMASLPKNPVKSMARQLGEQIHYKPTHSLNKKTKLPGSPAKKQWKSGSIS